MPNLIKVAKKQMAKIKYNLPEVISEEEKNYYHVAIVTSTPNPVTLEFDHKVKLQMFSKRSWIVAKPRFKQLGKTQVYIYHNPEGEIVELEEGGGEDGKKDKTPPKVDRAELIQKAKDAGYNGPLNVSNKVFQDFIENPTLATPAATEGAEGEESTGNTETAE